MIRIWKALWKLLFRDHGATMAEYGLLVALIALAALAAIEILGTGMSGMFENVGNVADGATIPDIP
jgi:Flp pilus assembly pilin Flp